MFLDLTNSIVISSSTSIMEYLSQNPRVRIVHTDDLFSEDEANRIVTSFLVENKPVFEYFEQVSIIDGSNRFGFTKTKLHRFKIAVRPVIGQQVLMKSVNANNEVEHLVSSARITKITRTKVFTSNPNLTFIRKSTGYSFHGWELVL